MQRNKDFLFVTIPSSSFCHLSLSLPFLLSLCFSFNNFLLFILNAENAEEEDDSSDENNDDKRIVDRMHPSGTDERKAGRDEREKLELEEREKGKRDERSETIPISTQREMLTQSSSHSSSQSMIPGTRAKSPLGGESTSFEHSSRDSLAKSSTTHSIRSPTSPLPNIPRENLAEGVGSRSIQVIPRENLAEGMGSRSIQVKLLNEETESIIKAIRSELLKFQSTDEPVPPHLASALRGKCSSSHDHGRVEPGSVDHSVRVTKYHHKDRLPKGLSVYDSTKGKSMKDVHGDRSDGGRGYGDRSDGGRGDGEDESTQHYV